MRSRNRGARAGHGSSSIAVRAAQAAARLCSPPELRYEENSDEGDGDEQDDTGRTSGRQKGSRLAKEVREEEERQSEERVTKKAKRGGRGSRAEQSLSSEIGVDDGLDNFDGDEQQMSERERNDDEEDHIVEAYDDDDEEEVIVGLYSDENEVLRLSQSKQLQLGNNVVLRFSSQSSQKESDKSASEAPKKVDGKERGRAPIVVVEEKKPKTTVPKQTKKKNKKEEDDDDDDDDVPKLERAHTSSLAAVVTEALQSETKPPVRMSSVPEFANERPPRVDQVVHLNNNNVGDNDDDNDDDEEEDDDDDEDVDDDDEDDEDDGDENDVVVDIRTIKHDKEKTNITLKLTAEFPFWNMLLNKV